MWTFDPTGAYVLLGFLLGFTWIFTGLRFFVRSSVIKSVFWDDWLILLSSVRSVHPGIPPSLRN